MYNRAPPYNNQSRKDKFVEKMEHYADDDSHGYSQKPPSGRWGPDFDCSSLIYQAADDAGYSVGTGSDKVRFTGTMLKDFEKAGFQILPFANVGVSDLKIGDILLNLALHAEVYVGDGKTVAATSSETGGYTGEAGDQTGSEIERHPVTTFKKEWDYILRPPKDEEEEGEEEMPMNYGANNMMPTQPWNNQMSGYPQGNSMNGYGSNNRMMPNQQPNMNGYPQGNLGQMNGYSQANAGYPQSNGNMQGYGYPQGGQMNGYQQGGQAMGYPQGMGDDDLCFVMGIEGAKNTHGKPNTRKAVFDEDKALMYILAFDQQGNVNDIRVYSFEECSEEMPQHLSPLMRNNQNGGMGMGMGQMADFITREEFEELKEMITNESVSKQSGNGRNGNQQSSSKLNARTN